MVAVPELPEDPALYASCIAGAGYFESVRVTENDLNRTASIKPTSSASVTANRRLTWQGI